MTHTSLMLERIEIFSWWYGQGVVNLHIMSWVGYSRELELLRRRRLRKRRLKSEFALIPSRLVRRPEASPFLF